jgi:hypothetical protein
MSLARRVFAIAGVYGLIVVLPLFAGPGRFAQDYPPPVTHPVFFYGFAGTALAWQVAFLIIARDPARYRPLMLPSILEKLVYGVAAAALFIAGEAQLVFLVAAIVDLVFGALFLVAWLRTTPTPAA